MALPPPPSPSAERRHWEALTAEAARNLPPGRIGGVIAELRQRGLVATRRANLFLALSPRRHRGHRPWLLRLPPALAHLGR
jgi:hypothetical protein